MKKRFVDIEIGQRFSFIGKYARKTPNNTILCWDGLRINHFYHDDDILDTIEEKRWLDDVEIGDRFWWGPNEFIKGKDEYDLDIAEAFNLHEPYYTSWDVSNRRKNIFVSNLEVW